MTGNTHDTEPIRVLGGIGKTGRRVVQRLRARGLQVRVGSGSTS
jgi:nucleoside-diphosphate-sugar epimerase